MSIRQRETGGDRAVSRRDVLKTVGLAAVAVGLARPAGLLAEDKEGPIAVGKPADYPVGAVKSFKEEKIVVLSDDDGVYAVSLVCTHRKGPLVYDEKKQSFICEWHGAVFDKLGAATKRPARKDLPWFQVKIEKDALFVDKGAVVEKGTRLKIPVT